MHCFNKRKVVNRVFKVLCIFEENPDDYCKYLKRVVTELLGYVDDKDLTKNESDAIYEAAISLRGLIRLEEEGGITHKIVRKIVLQHVNELQKTLV